MYKHRCDWRPLLSPPHPSADRNTWGTQSWRGRLSFTLAELTGWSVMRNVGGQWSWVRGWAASLGSPQESFPVGGTQTVQMPSGGSVLDGVRNSVGTSWLGAVVGGEDEESRVMLQILGEGFRTTL